MRFASAYNGHLPRATGYVIGYIRDPKKFKLNKYVQYLKSDDMIGTYFQVDRDSPVEVADDADYIWADGADRPVQDWRGSRFKEIPFRCFRRNYSFRLGNLAIKSGKDSWRPLEWELGTTMSVAMTNRTNRVVRMLETTSNWDTHVYDVNTLNDGAGKWDSASSTPGTPTYLAIKNSLMAAAQKVHLDTNGQVEPKDLVLVISPEAARRIVSAPEVHDFCKYGPFSKALLEDGTLNPNWNWGLPPQLHGFELIVEDAPYVPTRKDAAATASTGRTYIKSDTTAFLLSRKGGIDGVYGAPSFSTVQLYFHEWEAAVYTFDDTKNERKEGHVTDCFAELLVAPTAGALLTGIL